MKLFSILNKPSVKANNKQAGIVFLEYVIMAFIITVAVICALWWFYWHLQQMTWEVKQKLDTLKTLNCELGKPGGPESVQPTTEIISDTILADGYKRNTYEDPYRVSYASQKVTIKNLGPKEIIYSVTFGYDFEHEVQNSLPAGNSAEVTYTQPESYIKFDGKYVVWVGGVTYPYSYPYEPPYSYIEFTISPG